MWSISPVESLELGNYIDTINYIDSNLYDGVNAWASKFNGKYITAGDDGSIWIFVGLPDDRMAPLPLELKI